MDRVLLDLLYCFCGYYQNHGGRGEMNYCSKGDDNTLMKHGDSEEPCEEGMGG
jgi:hypothetical protein